ncbi:MAG: DEAD/DEAH box helicase family protein [Muribaculaceae bacterium]|nr:DEAD/DEAH box helicase family protein [Muribaculaceae bacterium]
MDNALIDNSENSKLVSYIKELITNPKCNHIMIASGYWDLPGTALIQEELRDFFRRGGKLDLLIGQEPMLQYYQVKKDEYNKFPDFYIQNDVNKLTEEYKPVGELILENGKTDKNPDGLFEIRVYGQDTLQPQFLHAKCYIFLGDQLGTGIIGSSNFTRNGLQNNDELNYLEGNGTFVAAPMTAHSTTKSHKVWFEEHWANSVPWTGKFIKDILEKAPIGVEILKEKNKDKLTPYEVYIKYLQLQFGDLVDSEVKEILHTYLPEGIDALGYQMYAVKQCYSVMKKYGGFMLGDVVGLGKTIVGVLLIRYFIENAEKLGRSNKVLIVTPPAIKNNWIETINLFDKNPRNEINSHLTFVTTGSIGKLFDEDGEDIDDDDLGPIKTDDYGLILIDESHNFRNSDTAKYHALEDLIEAIGSNGPFPYIGLLSATPQNNSPLDILNQIQLFQRIPNRSSLPGVEGGKLSTFFNDMDKKFMEARNMPQNTPEEKEKARAIIKEVSEKIRKSVLNDILIRRTRSDIKKIYGDDADKLKFPTVAGPFKLEYAMNPVLRQLFDDSIDAITDEDEDGNPLPGSLGFYRYAAITQFVDDKNKEQYEKRNLTVESITRRLKTIMQTLLVKRLESSIAAFIQSLKNLERYNNVMIDMLNHDCVYICPDIDVNKIHQENHGDFHRFSRTIEELLKRKVNTNNKKFKTSDFKPDYIEKLQSDKAIITSLLNRWEAIKVDPKFERFKLALDMELFDDEFNNPSGQDEKKLVIFTEAIDTIEHLEKELKSRGHKVLKVTSENREKKREAIAKNFDANLKPEEQKNDYDVIITTEVLAEGVNLHRSNVILNYDTPWNATRLMQRIGRVNRIGSKEEFVNVFNFFPSEDGNKRIKLMEKAYAKIQSFHEMFGEDNKVFTDEEELSDIDLRNLVDGEESPFNPFITELKEYKTANPERYEFIANIDPDNLGGIILNSSDDKSMFIFTDNTQGYVTVMTEQENDDMNVNIVSSLSTMEFLKCKPEDVFKSDEIIDNNLIEEAKQAYQQFVVNFHSRRDIDNKITEARQVIKHIRTSFKEQLTEKSKRVLKSIEKLVTGNDGNTIKIVLKYKNPQPSLFGIEDDINTLVESVFANIAQRADSKRGGVKLIISETK